VKKPREVFIKKEDGIIKVYQPENQSYVEANYDIDKSS
jgi:hypothetical protein